jgi:hypothetical protein
MESLRKRLEELANGDSSTSANDPFGVVRLSEEEINLCNKQAALVSELVRTSHSNPHYANVVLPPSIVLPLLS